MTGSAPSKDKECYFGEYCHKCQYKDLEESEEPCNECLTHTTNEWTHRPFCFKEEE